MMLEITLIDDEGDESVHDLPAKHEVCSRCEGHGTHLTPSIGLYAYSSEEFAESFDDEGRAEYFRRGGIYDVRCEQCAGKRVVAVVDRDACSTPELRGLLERHDEQEARRARERAADRRTQWAESGYPSDWY